MEEMARFMRGETVLTINGEVTFKDCLRNVDIQQFGGLYRAGPPDTFEYIKPIGLVPDHQIEKNANLDNTQ
jgi:hypothetical protein